MNKRMLLLTVLASGVLAAQEDLPGSSDHSLLTRFPQSSIVQYEVKGYDEVYWLTDRVPGGLAKYNEVRAEGKVTRITYDIPEDHSTFEVYRSYERGLQEGNFEILFSCMDDKCASIRQYLDLYGERPIGNSERFFSEGRRALVAKRDNNYVFLLVYIGENHEVIARLRIAEGDVASSNQILVDAAAISREIEETGSIALYDILFEVNKADIQDSSTAALQEIARYLAENPAVALYVVGHTDNTGALAHNLDLSRRRADAVVAALTTVHKIDGARLKADGLGPLAPIASNASEEGRGKNRRVQLVAQ